jgi:hypothetical protein
MARCPRCAAEAAAFERCEHCGLVLGFEGVTVVIQADDTALFQRVRTLARKQRSFSEWQELNGRQHLRATYAQDELDRFAELAAMAAPLAKKKAYVNGLEAPWDRAQALALECVEPREAAAHGGRSPYQLSG